MATKAGTAYVEVKYDPDSIRKLRADTKARGEEISRSWRDASTGLLNFDRAAKQVDQTMGNSRLGKTVATLAKGVLSLGSTVQSATDDFLKFATSGEAGLTNFGSSLSSLAPLLGVVTSAAAAFAAALLVLPAAAAGATFVLVALLDVVTTLGAVVVAATGPLVVFGGLLAGLGAAFVIGGKAALVGKHQFHDFGQTIKDLQEQFDKFGKVLGQLFLPYFERLAHAASVALTYLSQIAKLPLEQAFRSLATTGVKMVSKFLYSVANVLKRPFKLAIQIAFGAGGATANQAISNWWTSLTRYLFGYSERHPIKLGDHVIGFSTRQVDGALQPILDWFNRQHFTKTAKRWSDELINGFIHSGGRAQLAAWAGAVGKHSGQVAARAFISVFAFEIKAALPAMQHAFAAWAQRVSVQINTALSHAFHSMASSAANAAVSAGNAIKNAIGNALDSVRNAASRLWDYIRGLFSQALTIHISIPTPSIPSFHIPGFAGGVQNFTGGTALVGERGPELVTLPRGSSVTPNGGGGDTYVFIGNEAIDPHLVKVVRRENRGTARTVQAGKKW